MIANPTTLILGAGASAPTYPTGAGLRNRILELGANPSALDADDIVFIRRFRDSIVPSIDAFLADESTAKMEEIGRFFIAQALLPMEQGNPPSWYQLLFQAIRARPCEDRKHKLKIVTFNYDLSLEHTLVQAFSSTYGLGGTEARDAMDQAVEIIHVYGTLGSLNIQKGGGRRYGVDCDSHHIAEAARGIKIIGREPDSEHFQKAQEAIAGAEFVAILGFGYDETNIANLKLLELLRTKPVFSTGYLMGFGVRAWLRYQGFEQIIIGHETHTVEGFLQKSAFLHWANLPGVDAASMRDAINTEFGQGRHYRFPA